MTKPVRHIIFIIGLLSFASGIYLMLTDSDFSEYFPGLFIGVTLMGTVIYFKEKNNPNPYQ